MTKFLLLFFTFLGGSQRLLSLSLYEQQLVNNLASFVPLPGCMHDAFEQLPAAEMAERVVTQGAEKNILFAHYPELRNKLSYISLGDLPTPIIVSKQVSSQLGAQLFIKHDGMTGQLDAYGTRQFGGNKLRKLQYLLADALAHGHTTVLTFGCAGSNHALQTAVCAQQVGLKTICMLKPQPNSRVVQHNLRAMQAHRATLYYSLSRPVHGLMTAAVCYDCKQREGKFPYVIPTGGSCARGAIGYVEAAFELKQQIEQGTLPTPDRIYVTLGSGGTAAGLLLGIMAAGIDTHLYVVLDEPEEQPGMQLATLHRLFTETNELLRSCDQSFPRCEFAAAPYTIVTDCTGTEYGLFTPEGVAAMNCMRESEGIELDGTYTAKCCAALLRDLRAGACKGQNVLFWNTFCAQELDDVRQPVAYRSLPVGLQRYFVEGRQPLDRGYAGGEL